MKTYPAELVFTEQRVGRWRGRLLNLRQAFDVTSGRARPVAAQPLYLIEESEGGRFVVTMQGGKPGGRRYRTFPTLSAAQLAGVRWAGRRFRIPA